MQKPSVPQNKLDAAAKQLEEVLSNLGDYGSGSEVQEALIKADVTGMFNQNAKETILNVEEVQQSGKGLIAMAAFIGDAVDSIRESFELMAARQNEMNKAMAKEIISLREIVVSQDEMLKAMSVQPANDFRAEQTPAQELNKAAGAGNAPVEDLEESFRKVPQGFVNTFLQKAVSQGVMSTLDVARYESAHVLQKAHMIAIVNEFKQRSM